MSDDSAVLNAHACTSGNASALSQIPNTPAQIHKPKYPLNHPKYQTYHPTKPPQSLLLAASQMAVQAQVLIHNPKKQFSKQNSQKQFSLQNTKYQVLFLLLQKISPVLLLSVQKTTPVLLSVQKITPVLLSVQKITPVLLCCLCKEASKWG